MKSCRLPILSSILLFVSIAAAAKMQQQVTFMPAGTSIFHFIRSPHKSAFAIATPHLRQMFVARYSAPAASKIRPAAAVAEVTEQQDDVYETAGSQKTYQQPGLGQYANAIPQPAFAEDIRRPAIEAIQKALLLQQQTSQLQQQSLQQLQQQSMQQIQQNQYYQPQQQQYYQPQQVLSNSVLPQQQYYQAPANDQYYQQSTQQVQQYYQPQFDQQQLQALFQQQYQQKTGPVQFQQPSAAASETSYNLAESAANIEHQNTKQLGVAYSPSTDVSSFKYASQGLNYNF
ncbi:putative transcriptional regulator cudA [Ctenocephalides felis]|uniref:putative transcriptional regulator cudA n=1 Tax=Ctenocephalides felis TaxID=7515 RepID=UPI000E6E3C52|nr:putative transcriptional regulator cudA [Ctenocephalides felis]